MVKKYTIVRIPTNAYKGFMEKKAKIEKRIKVWTGKNVRIPLTRIMEVVATNPVDIGERQVINLGKKMRRVRRSESY